MARSSCQHCHGLGFTLDALADDTLINNNFSAAPTAHVRSMDLAEKEKKRREDAAAKEGAASSDD
jgi:hypothetical protein